MEEGMAGARRGGSSYGGCGGSAAGSGTKCGRWNPTVEQVKVLTDLFRSGLRTPSTEQIQKISKELSLYGKIESKNVFYWFQNHKARERQKRRRVSKDSDTSSFHSAPTPPFKCFGEINQVPYESNRPKETLQLFPLSSYNEPDLGKIRVFSDKCKENNLAFAFDQPPLDLRLSFF